MSRIQLLSVGDVDARLLTELSGWLSQEFAHPCDLLATNLDPAFAFHTDRGQYHSTEILARMRSFAGAGCWRLLGITARDLYIPILTFVFGEAQMGDACALVSYHRLRRSSTACLPMIRACMSVCARKRRTSWAILWG